MRKTHLRTTIAAMVSLQGFSFLGLAAPPENAGIVFRVPKGWKAELFAADPQLGNPVAFCLDEQGRIYVAEEYRFNRGTEENRTRPFLLEDDLQLQTAADRLAMYRKWSDRFEGGMKWFSEVLRPGAIARGPRRRRARRPLDGLRRQFQRPTRRARRRDSGSRR